MTYVVCRAVRSDEIAGHAHGDSEPTKAGNLYYQFQGTVKIERLLESSFHTGDSGMKNLMSTYAPMLATGICTKYGETVGLGRARGVPE